MGRYKIIHGFALSNDRCMKKLEKYSEEGWYFKKYLVFFMLLEKVKRKNVSIDCYMRKNLIKNVKSFMQLMAGR